MPLLECDNGHLFNGDKYGDTCPNCGLKVSEKKEQEREKTPEELAEELYVSEQSYVCGWLVCIHGANKGRAYEIHPGKNFIGSSDKMDIRVLGDQRIEKVNHASISYDAKDRSTMLMPGDSSGMVYCQEQAVYLPTLLEPFHIIELGQSRFIYAPLCGSGFSWEDYKD